MYKKTHQKIVQWYKAYGRHSLPWRATHSAYEIYISEIMLQQTQVKTVLERFYFPFLEAFPTLQDVASATEDEVLKLWEGLGYYTRARNIHATSKLVKTLPNDVDALQELPGIGRSTAHAIACFGFDKAVPILDANVKRILFRVYALKTATPKELWEKAYALLDTKNAYIYNQAMMDIGATVCTKNEPKCSVCPLASICQAKHNNPTHYPTPKKKKAAPIKEINIIIYRYKNRLGVYRRTTKLLNGMWGFEQTKREAIDGIYIGNISHKYSHFGIDAKVYIIDDEACDTCEFYTIDALKDLALSTIDTKVLALYEKRASKK